MKTTVRIEAVNSNASRNQFIRLPWKLYRNDPNWVPPLLLQIKRQLNERSNPFFNNGEVQLLLAFRGNDCVGRIAAIINNRHNQHYNERCGFFGFYECNNDTEASQLLFREAEKWLYDKGMALVRGPVNLATYAECGLLVEGYNGMPSLQMPYNLKFYEALMTSSGYMPETDLLAYEIAIESMTGNNPLMGKLDRVSSLAFRRNGITFRKFNKNNYEAEIERIRELFNDYMSDNWGFVPLTRSEFRFLSDEMKPLLEPELALFAEHNNQPVGFAIALPNINQVLRRLNGKLFPTGILKYFYYKRYINEARVVLLGVSKSFRKKGLEAWFYRQLVLQAQKRGIQNAELSWISEHNKLMVHAVENIGARLYRRYRIFQKNLNAECNAN